MIQKCIVLLKTYYKSNEFLILYLNHKTHFTAIVFFATPISKDLNGRRGMNIDIDIKIN